MDRVYQAITLPASFWPHSYYELQIQFSEQDHYFYRSKIIIASLVAAANKLSNQSHIGTVFIAYKSQ